MNNKGILHFAIFRSEWSPKAVCVFPGAPVVINTTSSADVHRMNAVARGIDPNNKTASIRSRHNKRMTSVPLDEIFTQSIDIDYVDAHVQHVDVHARDNVERTNSTPNLLVGSRTHVTTVKVGDENIESDDRVSYRNTSCSGERIYAQPFKTHAPGHRAPGHAAPDQGSYRNSNLHVQIRNTDHDRAMIPQPPSHCPPPPPMRTTRDLESTTVRQPHIYSNLSSQEPSPPVSEDRISLFESSFRPGSNARLSKVPAEPPMAAAGGSGGYSRTYSSPGGQGKQDVQIGQPPDYDSRDNGRDRVVRQQTEPINSLRESHRMTTTSYAAATLAQPSGGMRTDIAAAIKFAADSRSKQAQQKVTQVPPPPSHAPPPPPPPSHVPPPPPSHAPPTPPTSRSLYAPSRTPTPPSHKPPQSSAIPPPPPPPPPQSHTPPPPPPPPIQSGHFDIDAIRRPPPLKPVPRDVPRESPPETPQDQSRAALLAAVAKRRNIVDNSDMEGLADSIENRIHRSKKLLTTVYKSDQTKQQLSSPESPGKMVPLSLPDQAKKPDERKTTESEATVSSASPAQQRATPNRTAVIPGDTSTDDNFKSIAEKKRQEWLQRKTGATNPALTSTDGEEVDSKEKDDERLKPRRTAPMPPSKHLKPTIGGTQDPAPNLGGLAQVIAQKAQQFQQSNNNKSPERNNNSTNDRNAINGSNGHTVAGMNTARGAPLGSRAIYTSPNSQCEAVTQNGLKTRTFTSSQRDRDCPPPLLAGHHAMGLPRGANVVGPATGTSQESRQAWRNGDSDSTTVGWLVNPSPVHETALREKLSQRRDIAPQEVSVDDDRFGNVSQLVMMHEHQYVPQMVDISPIVDVAFIPPPLSFENEPHNGLPANVIPDDSVSTVSSLSTLSTLSSTDHDTHDVMHFRQAPSVIADVECELLAPPPPGFGDSPSVSVHDLREDFIPPPVDFGETTPAAVTSLRNVLKPSVSSTHFIDVSFRDKPIQNWTVSDVCDWLDSVHMGEHKQAFMRDQVNGQQLLYISRARLISLGVAQLADQALFDHVVKGVTF